jgi:diamine N-acetyltransferase
MAPDIAEARQKRGKQAMKLIGERVTIRPMVRRDVEAMITWRPTVDPLYEPYDLPGRDRADHLRWFQWRSHDPSRRLFVIEDEQAQVIGSLTLREIDGQQSARLGITLGADYVSQGYGTEALRLFIDYHFGVMGFAHLMLDVCATNLRAVRTYRAVGFSQVGEHYRPAAHSSYDIVRREERYRHLRGFFRRQGTSYQVLFYDMEMTREEWQAHRQAEAQE